jgi:hypothetical protein
MIKQRTNLVTRYRVRRVAKEDTERFIREVDSKAPVEGPVRGQGIQLPPQFQGSSYDNPLTWKQLVRFVHFEFLCDTGTLVYRLFRQALSEEREDGSYLDHLPIALYRGLSDREIGVILEGLPTKNYCRIWSLFLYKCILFGETPQSLVAEMNIECDMVRNYGRAYVVVRQRRQAKSLRIQARRAGSRRVQEQRPRRGLRPNTTQS